VVAPGEIPPIPPGVELRQFDYLRQLERWSLFRFTPVLMNTFKTLENIYRTEMNVRNTHFGMWKDVKTPSLWAYFYTLPQWVREHPVVRNIFLSLEHHTPRTSMRQKEIGLNLAASLILPLDEEMERMLEVLQKSEKYILNCQRGEQMLRELPMVRLDPDRVGWEEFNDNTLDPREARRGSKRMDEGDVTIDIEEQRLEIEEEEAEKQRDFEIDDVSADKVLTDFKIPEPMGLHEHWADEDHNPLPMDFYDNEDGFWDEFLEKKHKKYEAYSIEEMIVGGPFYKH
jgi:hypothetical protein